MSYIYNTPENENRTTPAGIVVTRSRILSTQFVVYTAYEPMREMGSHQTITTIGGDWYGTIDSRRDESTFAHLRGGSPERIAAVRAHYAALDAESYAAILSVFPEAAAGARSGGQIETYHGE